MRRWLVVALIVCAGFGAAPGSMRPVDIGVLSCAIGQAVDPQASDQAAAANEAREVRCSFKPGKNGPEETYAGVLKGVSASGTPANMATMLWAVRAPIGTEPGPGILQQAFSADVATPPGQAAPLFGDQNAQISLHAMADKAEGSAAQAKPPTPSFVVTAVELKVKTSAT
jgi:hypothetical protein